LKFALLFEVVGLLVLCTSSWKALVLRRIFFGLYFGYFDDDVLVISWTEFFYRKVIGFSPKVGFPRVKKYCVYCAWLSLYDSVISVAVYFS